MKRSYIKTKSIKDKSDRKQLEIALDKLVHDILELRDRRCIQCGSAEITTGHVFSRRVRATKWKLYNCFAQCSFCNSAHENDRQPFYNWVINHIGQNKFNKLKKEWDTQTKLYSTDLEDMKRKLEEMKEIKDPKYWCTLTYTHHEFLHGRCVHCGEIEHLIEKELTFTEENLAARDWLNSED